MLLFEQCFNGLYREPILSSWEYIFIKHANKRDNYRIFTRYNNSNRSSFKRDLGELLNINLDNNNWQWHHVVEGTHIKRVFNKEDADSLYNKQIPTVLIHQQTEHIDYNLLHAHGVNSVFNLYNGEGMLTGEKRSKYILELKNLYSRVYDHDLVLKKVALNILSFL